MTARLSRPVSVRRLTREERVAVEATAQERAAIAEELDVLSIESLTADVTLRPWRKDGVRVEGRVRGALSQACVVTLEPVATTVDETFDVRLHPEVASTGPVDVDVDAADPPELLETDMVDVGAIVLEHFVLGIEPYPRAPGAELDLPEGLVEDEPDPSPFAVLASLKNG